MLVETAQLTENARLEADVVIAGGGVAGIALARQLADAGLSVLVLESGGEQPEPRTQSLYEGTMTLGGPGNDARPLNDYLVSSRLRCFGGSGNVWGGKCAPLDPVDFEKRDWIRHSGWPIDRAGLQPFYDRASALLELPSFGERAASVVVPDEPLLAGRTSSLAIRPRCYTRYTGAAPGDAYAAFKRSAAGHARVTVYLHANVTAIKLDQRVQSLDVQELDGRKHSAVGRAYVLAAGGIENVRLLLASNDVHRDGIGNHSDWLGRGFQGHTTISQGENTCMSLLRQDAQLGLFNNKQRERPHAVIGLSDAAQRRYRTVNFTATLMEERSAAPAVEACIAKLAQRVASTTATARRSVYFVHGVDNFYVAGSSVFPTSGIANPTMTLLALTFRLGDHLAAAMKKPA